MMDLGPPANVVCEECGGDGEWKEVTWQFDGDEKSDKERRGFVSCCSQCGLILRLSLGHLSWDGEFEFFERRLLEFEMYSTAVEREVSVLVDVIQVSMFRDEGEAIIAEVVLIDEDSLSPLEGEKVLIDGENGEVRDYTDRGQEVVGRVVD